MAKSNDLILNEPKFSRDQTEGWSLARGVAITQEGRKIVQGEPNIEPETLELLLQSDWDKLTDKQKRLYKNSNAKEIAEQTFFVNGEIGMIHLAQCIKEDLNQCMADLCARYADERRISFLAAAIFITSLTSVKALYYYEFSFENGYRRVRWQPRQMYIPPKIEMPPRKKQRRVRKKPLTSIPKPPEVDLAPCPLCGSKAVLVRCGQYSRLWHVCCTDPEETCENYTGMAPSKFEKGASKAWNDYVAEHEALVKSVDEITKSQRKAGSRKSKKTKQEK